MTKFITTKANDGVDHNARQRGIDWLLLGSPSSVFIYTPRKRTAEDMAKDDVPSAALFKSLLKLNSTTVGLTTINLCFGSGAGACGSPPPHGFRGKILLCYADPNSADWLLMYAPLADVCLLPWSEAEAAVWRATHSPTVI